MAFSYTVFGLHVESAQAIPGLTVRRLPPPADVRIDLAGRDDGPPPESALSPWFESAYRDEEGRPSLTVWRLDGGNLFRLRYADGTQFLLDGQGTYVRATWPSPLTAEDAATYLLGPVLGFLLRLRGATCLHASAVAVGNRAVALVGGAGAGKSTTAAAFACLGHGVLADDTAALREAGGAFLVQPAYPHVRLWPESVAALFGSADRLPLLAPHWGKRCLDPAAAGGAFEDRPLPLGAVYLLAERSPDPAAPLFEAVSPRDALLTLTAHTYTGYLPERTLRARDFALLGRLVTSVPVRKVTPSADAGRLASLCEGIVRDIQNQCRASARAEAGAPAGNAASLTGAPASHACRR